MKLKKRHSHDSLFSGSTVSLFFYHMHLVQTLSRKIFLHTIFGTESSIARVLTHAHCAMFDLLATEREN